MTRSGDAARTPGLWSPVSAPYTALRAPLVDAERRPNGSATATSTPLWRLLMDTADDQRQVKEAADALLADTVSGWRLGADDGRSRSC